MSLQTEYYAIQKEELDALELIYLEEMNIEKPTVPIQFTIECRPFLDLDPEEVTEFEDLRIFVKVEFPPNYPQEQPIIVLNPSYEKKINQFKILEIEKLIKEINHDKQGQPVIFDIVERIREWVQSELLDDKARNSHHRKRNNIEVENESEKRKEYINLTKKSTWTPVNAANFHAWRERFIRELEEKRKFDLQKNKEVMSRLTGKQYFERKYNETTELEGDIEDGEDIDYKLKDVEEQKTEKDPNLFCYEEDLFADDDVNLDNL